MAKKPASYIQASDISLDTEIRFNYNGKVRQGFPRKWNSTGFTMELVIDGDEHYAIGETKHKNFRTDDIDGNILMFGKPE